jgi:hypothetical protein
MRCSSIAIALNACEIVRPYLFILSFRQGRVGVGLLTASVASQFLLNVSRLFSIAFDNNMQQLSEKN